VSANRRKKPEKTGRITECGVDMKGNRPYIEIFPLKQLLRDRGVSKQKLLKREGKARGGVRSNPTRKSSVILIKG